MNPNVWEKPPAELSISRSELHVWRVHLDNVNYPLKYLISLLSPEEMKRSKSFMFERDQHRYQITHSMKRLILGGYLGCDAQCLRFEVGNYGKPSLASLQNSLNIQFNLSHSHKLILIAITLADSIGIDIEYYKKKLSIESLAEIIFSPFERNFFSALNSQQEKKEVFFRCWTRKEAYLKAIGTGLTQDISRISVDLSEFSVQDWLDVPSLSETENIKWKLFTLDMGNAYTAAVVATHFQRCLFAYDVKDII